jgi:hypothetical protein
MGRVAGVPQSNEIEMVIEKQLVEIDGVDRLKRGPWRRPCGEETEGEVCGRSEGTEGDLWVFSTSESKPALISVETEIGYTSCQPTPSSVRAGYGEITLTGQGKGDSKKK